MEIAKIVETIITSIEFSLLAGYMSRRISGLHGPKIKTVKRTYGVISFFVRACLGVL